MYKGSFLTVLVTSYLFVLSGAQQISTCPNGHVDVEENKTIIMRCEGFADTHTVMWKMGTSVFVLAVVATCTPTQSCSAQDGVAGADRITDNGKEYSELFLNVMRSLRNYVVVCVTEGPAGTAQSLPCRLNVTEPRTESTSGETASTSTQVATTQTSTSFPGTIVGVSVGVLVLVIFIVVVVALVIIKKRKDTTYEKPRRRQNAEGPEHDYVDLQNTATMSAPSPQTSNSPESATSMS